VPGTPQCGGSLSSMQEVSGPLLCVMTNR
jgi:hypothetical protein